MLEYLKGLGFSKVWLLLTFLQRRYFTGDIISLPTYEVALHLLVCYYLETSAAARYIEHTTNLRSDGGFK